MVGDTVILRLGPVDITGLGGKSETEIYSWSLFTRNIQWLMSNAEKPALHCTQQIPQFLVQMEFVNIRSGCKYKSGTWIKGLMDLDTGQWKIL